jgi:hypothetical protein
MSSERSEFGKQNAQSQGCLKRHSRRTKKRIFILANYLKDQIARKCSQTRQLYGLLTFGKFLNSTTGRFPNEFTLDVISSTKLVGKET